MSSPSIDLRSCLPHKALHHTNHSSLQRLTSPLGLESGELQLPTSEASKVTDGCLSLVYKTPAVYVVRSACGLIGCSWLVGSQDLCYASPGTEGGLFVVNGEFVYLALDSCMCDDDDDCLA